MREVLDHRLRRWLEQWGVPSHSVEASWPNFAGKALPIHLTGFIDRVVKGDYGPMLVETQTLPCSVDLVESQLKALAGQQVEAEDGLRVLDVRIHRTLARFEVSLVGLRPRWAFWRAREVTLAEVEVGFAPVTAGSFEYWQVWRVRQVKGHGHRSWSMPTEQNFVKYTGWLPEHIARSVMVEVQQHLPGLCDSRLSQASLSRTPAPSDSGAERGLSRVTSEEVGHDAPGVSPVVAPRTVQRALWRPGQARGVREGCPTPRVRY